MPRGRVLRTALVVLFWLVILEIAAGIVLAEITLHPPRRRVDAAARARAQTIAQEFSATLTDVEVRARDGAYLRGWFFRPEKPGGKAVILLHGVADSRVGMLPYTRLFLRKGYTVLLPDLRAHGESDGRFAAYGILERDDIKRWVDSLGAEQIPRCIYALAESMGAGILLQSLELEPKLCAIAAESPFSSFREVAYDRVGRPFGAGPWLGQTVLRIPIEVGFLYTRWRYHINLEQAMPERSVKDARVPILLIHGKQDGNIPPRHSEAIQAANPAATSLWLVPGAEHTGALGASPAEFEQRVTSWFESHTPR